MNKLKVSDNKIRNISNKHKTISSLAKSLGYESYNNIGSNTIIRFKRVLGKKVYNEITIGKRLTISKPEWTKLS